MNQKQHDMRELLLETWDYISKFDAIEYLISLYGRYDGYLTEITQVYDSIPEYEDGFTTDN